MISGETNVVGLIGDPVKHSISPQIHNSAFRELGLDYVYVAFRVSSNNLADSIRGIKSLEIDGINVTIPHKSAIITELDEVHETAKKIGAVNTIKKTEKGLKGFNTDGIGVLKSLKERIGGLKNKKILLLGAGGAARAISFILAEKGVELTISNRTVSKGEELANEIENETKSKVSHIPQEKKAMAEEIKSSDILINSTSVGMHPKVDETLVESEDMHSELVVMDIVYNPLKTRLLEEAEKAGAETISGLGMLVYQGAASFEIWIDEEPPIKIMKEAARKALEGKRK